MSRARDLAAFVSNADGDIKFDTDTLFIDSSANRVGIGTNTPTHGLEIVESADAFGARITNNSDGSQGLQIRTSDNDTGQFILDLQTSSSATGTDYASKLVVDKAGNLLVGTTSSFGTSGITLGGNNVLYSAAAGQNVTNFQRYTSNGEIVRLGREGTTVGSIGGSTAVLTIVGKDGDAGIGVQANQYGNLIYPIVNVSANTLDDGMDIGYSSGRFDDIYATNGTIQTSDEREKQNIASLTSAEITAATAISKLFKTFKWKSKVSEKGDNARTHTGVIAQQVQTAMSDAGLDAGDYAFFINTVWWGQPGNA